LLKKKWQEFQPWTLAETWHLIYINTFEMQITYKNKGQTALNKRDVYGQRQKLTGTIYTHSKEG